MSNKKIKLEIIRLLDKGGFAEVFLAKNQNTNELLALKKINKKNLNNKEKEYLQNEIDILTMIQHPNIVRLVCYFKKNDFIYLVLEYCNGGSLYKNLYEYKNKYGTPFPEKLVRHFMKRILLGIKHLHENKIIHRDLKLNNILLKYDNDIDKKNNNYNAAQIKIIDFNISFRYQQFLNNFPFTAVGTIPNMPPSIVNNIMGPPKIYDEKIDIWSLGTLCYEMLFGNPLFNNMTKEQVFQNILLCNFTIPNIISKEARSFLYAMLQKDGKNRLNASQLLNHEFIKRNNNTILNQKKIINGPTPPNFLIHNNNSNQIIKIRPKLSKKEIKRNNSLPKNNWNNKKVQNNILNQKFNFNIMCNGCGINNISEKLYKCQTCFEVNYCEICYNKFKNNHNHPFIVMQKKVIILPKNLSFKIPKTPVIQKKNNHNLPFNKIKPLNLFHNNNQNMIRFDTQ